MIYVTQVNKITEFIYNSNYKGMPTQTEVSNVLKYNLNSYYKYQYLRMCSEFPVIFIDILMAHIIQNLLFYLVEI